MLTASTDNKMLQKPETAQLDYDRTSTEVPTTVSRRSFFAGLLLAGLGLVVLLLASVDAARKIGDSAALGESAVSLVAYGLGGSLLVMLGFAMMTAGSRSVAAAEFDFEAGVVRDDIEPLSKAGQSGDRFVEAAQDERAMDCANTDIGMCCVACSAANAANARYCNQCGAKL